MFARVWYGMVWYGMVPLVFSGFDSNRTASANFCYVLSGRWFCGSFSLLCLSLPPLALCGMVFVFIFVFVAVVGHHCIAPRGEMKGCDVCMTMTIIQMV